MKRGSRLSGILHVLLHMAEQSIPMTSEALAVTIGTNPVVIRHTLAGLRDRGYVVSEKGHGGGWTLACDLDHVTLRDIYEALGEPEIFAMGNRTEAPGCLVEQAVNTALGNAFDEAEARLLARFGEVTLGQLMEDVRRRRADRGGGPSLDDAHRH